MKKRDDKLSVKGLAHDINNGLMGSLGHVQSALRISKPGSKEHERLKKALSSIMHSAYLVKKLYALDDDSSEKKEQNLKNIIEKTSYLYEGRKSPDIKLTIDIKEDIIFNIEPEVLEQSLLNLLLNAQQAITDAGEITITSNIDEASKIAKIFVRDNGCGIAPENLSKIFQENFSTKNLKTNSGKGLSNVQKILTKQGGSIFVESTLEKETIFTINLPYVSIIKEAQNTEIIECNKVLLIDDKGISSDYLRPFLEKMSLEVESYDNPEEALEWYKKHNADISLVFLHLNTEKSLATDWFPSFQAYNVKTPIIISSKKYKDSPVFSQKGENLHFIEAPINYTNIVKQISEALTA